ncbi:MAG: HAD-IIA family hydrolase [Candidatus Thorarchaeota archaeon]
MKRFTSIIDAIKLAIFDLDGVIYRGNFLIPGVDKVIQELRKNSIKVVYNSNNSTATREMYVNRLSQMGIISDLKDIYTSAFITSEEISEIKKNANVYIIGEIGLKEEIKAKGHAIKSESDDYSTVDFVIVGLDREFNYKKLSFAQKCILEGKAEFYATNNDATLPMDNGLLPGAGVMVNALEICTKTKPKITFGKPNPYGIQKILRDYKISPRDAVIFGDRVDTDIAAGNNAGIHTVLVLTGVTTKLDAEKLLENPNAEKSLIPDLIVNSLEEIFMP